MTRDLNMNFVTLADFTLNDQEKLQYEIGEFIKWTLKYNIHRNLILSKDEYNRTLCIGRLIKSMDTVLVVDYANNSAEIIRNRFRTI